MRMYRVLAIALLAPVVSVGAQQATGRIEGQAKDPQSGAPLPGAQVVLFAPRDTTFVRAVTTDSAGRFSFAGLRGDQYRMQITHARLDSLGLPPLAASLRLPRGQMRRVTLGEKRVPALAAGSCGENQFDHPAGIEIANIARTVGNGAAQLATMRPGDQGINTQYTLVEGCRRAPLSEQGLVPPR
jgi:hypothetical protein